MSVVEEIPGVRPKRESARLDTLRVHLLQVREETKQEVHEYFGRYRHRGEERPNGQITTGARTTQEEPASEKLRGKVRSAWLDSRCAGKDWTSDTEIEKNHGPTYNTIRRYRSGAKSTRDAYVRQKLATSFGCPVAEVPE